MAFNINGTTPTAINFNGSPVYTLICNGVTVWTAAVTVTYYVDSGKSYQESVVYGNSVLSPTSFTPSKDGYTFVGWRENSTASSSVLTSKTMGTTPISLYAVFKKTVTLTYYNNSTTASVTSGTQYYNNGNVANPTFTLSQADKSGWTKRGWSTGTGASASIAYSNGTSISIGSNTTIYGCYSKSLTLTYYDGGLTTAQTKTGTQYYNSAGNTVNPSQTMTQTAKSGWTERGWATSNAANASISYNNGAIITFSSNLTIYGCYQKTVTLSYNGNGASSGSVSSQSGTAYYNSSGNKINPSFTLANNGYSKAENKFSKWAQGSSSGTQYAVGAIVTLSDSTTFYAVWIAPTTITVNKSASITSDWSSGNYNSTPVYSSVITNIDCTNYSYASITVKYTKDSGIINATEGVTGQDGYIYIGTKRSSLVYNWISNGPDKDNLEELIGGANTNTWTTVTVNISDLTGSQSVKAYGTTTSMSATFTISTIKLYN